MLEMEIVNEGVSFRIKGVKRCWSSKWGKFQHHHISGDQFWIHRDDHNGYSSFEEIRVFMCACGDCPHGVLTGEVSDAFMASRAFERFEWMRAAWKEREKERVKERKYRAAEVQSLAICEKIAGEGYTEEISYEIKELIGGLRGRHGINSNAECRTHR